MSRRSYAVGLTAAALALVLDQLSKWVVVRYFDGGGDVVALGPLLTVIRTANHGVSFGMFNDGAGWQSWFFSGFAVLVVAVLLHLLGSVRTIPGMLGHGLIIGGAIGNLIDRVRYGSVVDFVDFHVPAWGFQWFIFNVADAAICVGVGLWLLDSLLQRPESPKA